MDNPKVMDWSRPNQRKPHSVPSTPLRNSFEPLSPVISNRKIKKQKKRKPQPSVTEESSPTEPKTISFVDYLKDELTVADFDSAQELKRERVTNFLSVPGAIEKLMGFGFFVCLDSFLYTFTILPLRFCLAFYHFVVYILCNLRALLDRKRDFIRLRPSQKCDLLKGFLVMMTCVTMYSFDPSRVYHSIRGQAVLKLYVVYNVLEICDKLCCSLGVDILDALFSKSTLGNSPQDIHGTAYAKRQLRPITLFVLAAGYMVLHTAILFFQMITLNVAINFYSNALLSLLISNQFVEIKQSVFKRFEKENLFQLTCSDIVERFQQSAFLFVITLRNIIEISESGPSSILPSTFVPLFKLPASTSFNSLMTPVLMVILSELLVDWLKHAFITKFNHIRPSIYGKYIDILCKDLVIGSPGRMTGKNHAFVDQSPVVSRRIGFPVLPLACLYIRMMQQILPMIFMSQSQGPLSTASLVSQAIFDYSFRLPEQFQIISYVWLEHVLDKSFRFVIWSLFVSSLVIILLALKVLVGMNLLGFAYKRYSSIEERDRTEVKKDEEMKAMSKDEANYNRGIHNYLSQAEDHMPKPAKYTLETVDRFSMVKSRIP
ncbi:eukaryotic membrane protein family-domain-containing protein [Sporodiniella umbellata]|nr:eukaryotic membrane protein family-domain-containing protein [Sporodiniella umbellata]